MNHSLKEQDRVKPQIRHCMVVHSYYPFDETRVQRQAEALIGHGYEVDIICLHQGHEPKTEESAGITIYRLPVQRDKKRGAVAQLFEYLTFLFLAFLKLTRLHLRRHYHVVQVHNLPDFLVFVALIPRLTGSRVILDLHDLMPEFYCAKFGSAMDSWPVRLISWQEWLSCRFAHHVITVTELWRQTLIKRGVAAHKCSVVMNLADLCHFSTTSGVDDISKSPGFRLIYHGTITRRYGLDLVLKALAQLRQELPDLSLIVHGRGEYLETLLHLVEEFGLQDRVHIGTEFLTAAELYRLILSAQVGLVPYRRDIFTDGILPTKLMEYTALGVPAIVSRTPVISHYFDETMVEFFKPEDVDDLTLHIRTLYDNPTRLSELAHNAAKFNERYNWATQSAEYVRLVEKLATKP